jgi:hypothetical protein
MAGVWVRSDQTVRCGFDIFIFVFSEIKLIQKYVLENYFQA